MAAVSSDTTTVRYPGSVRGPIAPIQDLIGRMRADKGLLRRVLMIGGVAIVAAVSLAFWLTGGRYVSTDDSYVQAAKLMVSTVQQIVDYLNSEQRDPSKIGSLSGILQSLVQYLEAMELKISSNFAVTEKDVRDAISSTVELLPEISESFQTGKDREALEKINRIVSVLELCCIYIKKNFASFSESQRDEIDGLYEEINSLLTQIVSAFENGDVVLLGDLLEYELPGKFEIYKNIILGD